MLFDASPQAALGFLQSQVSHIETKVWAKKYPSIVYQDLIPIDTSAHPWAPTITYYSTDMVGAADWHGGSAQDFPFAEVNRRQNQTAVHLAKTGYRYDIQELNQARMVGMDLPDDKAAAARRAYEEKMESVAFLGDAGKSLTGLLNSTAVTTAAAPNGVAGAHNGNVASPLWTSKTPLEILADVNNALTGMWVASNTIEMADTLLLPLAAFSHIAVTPVSTLSMMTILEYIKTNNVFTATTGRPLTIRALRQLNTAGAGNTGRMIAYTRDTEVLKMHVPMPLEFLPVQQILLDFVVPGIFRLGGLDIRRPGAMRYLDGIA